MNIETGITPPDQAPRNESINTNIEEVRLAGNRGTCGGVESALATTEQVMEIIPEDVNVYTNNTPVNFPKAFEKYGERLVVVDGDISRVPDNGIYLVSAHGDKPQSFEEAARRGIFIVNTTCAIVLDEQQTVRNNAAEGLHTVLIGEENHPEVIGVRGQVEDDEITIIDPKKELDNIIIPDNSVVIAKTTYAPSDIQDTVQQLQAINNTVDASRAHACYAVRNRQFAGREMMDSVDFWLVVGDITSHNSRELKKIGPERNIPAALITGPEEIDWDWFGEDIRKLGVSAGASVPEEFTQAVLQPFRDLGIPVIELPQAVKEDYRIFKQPNAQLEALKQRYSVV